MTAPPFSFHATARDPGTIIDRSAWAVTPDSAAAAFDEISAWPGYQATDLVSLPGLASAAGWGGLWYKDESTRFGLGSFKALGGAYAVSRLLRAKIAAATGETATTADLQAGRHRTQAQAVTVCCATDGNHGRSVAWGAERFGCRAVIFLHSTVSQAREDAIARYGAEIIRTPGNYDDSVRQAAETAAAEGWTVVSDTSYPGYTEIPADVMAGYTVMAEEAVRQLPDGIRPTHVFLQGGVGGMAAAVAAHLYHRLNIYYINLYIVEPDKAACLFESGRAGAPVAVGGALDTIMAGLACGEPSVIAWPILQALADGFLTVPDQAAEDVMRRLADGSGGDPALVAGESAVAGLAGALAATADPASAEAMGLNAQSRVPGVRLRG